MRVTQRDDGLFAFKVDSFSQALIREAKSTPGMKWDAEAKHWYGYSDAVAETVKKLRDAGLFLNDDALPRPVDWRKLDWCKSPKSKLRDYQVKGIQFLVEHAAEGCILADTMGAGKSSQAIIAAAKLEGHVLVVCPSFVRGVWAGAKGELVKWWPKDLGVPKHIALEGVKGKGPIPECRVVVCHYDILHAWKDELLKWGVDTLIIDECHFVSNPEAKRSKILKDLAKQAKHRIGLSGTPLTNRPRDLWNVVDTLCPGRLGSFFGYGLAYCAGHQETIGYGFDAKAVWNWDGKSNLDELRRRLSYFMLRRTHDDIKLELPPKTRQVLDLRVPSAHRVELSPDMLLRESNAAIRKILDIAADGKFSEVVKLLKQHAEEGYKVVCFCWRRAVAERIVSYLKDEGVDAAFIHGEVTQADRDKRIEAAKEHEGAFVLCASIDVASVGIDLSFASIGVFAEITYEPHELIQAEARLHRFGQDKPVLIQYTIAQGSAEELVRDVLISKLDTWSAAGVGESGGDGLKSDLVGLEEDPLDALYRELMIRAEEA